MTVPISYRSLLKRAEGAGILTRVCRGLYLYTKSRHHRGDLLFHAAARLRSDAFNYISLETALSDEGIISQMPLQWITIMSSGRSSTIRCGQYGTIELVHTKKAAGDLSDFLVYDKRCRMWRAKPALALRDLRRVGRNLDLIDEKEAEFSGGRIQEAPAANRACCIHTKLASVQRS